MSTSIALYPYSCPSIRKYLASLLHSCAGSSHVYQQWTLGTRAIRSTDVVNTQHTVHAVGTACSCHILYPHGDTPWAPCARLLPSLGIRGRQLMRAAAGHLQKILELNWTGHAVYTAEGWQVLGSPP